MEKTIEERPLLPWIGRGGRGNTRKHMNATTPNAEPSKSHKDMRRRMTNMQRSSWPLELPEDALGIATEPINATYWQHCYFPFLPTSTFWVHVKYSNLTICCCPLVVFGSFNHSRQYKGSFPKTTLNFIKPTLPRHLEGVLTKLIQNTLRT